MDPSTPFLYTSNTGEYSSSVSNVNFGHNHEFGISLDSNGDDISKEQASPPRPIGRDKARQKGKATCSSDFEANMLSLFEEIAETNRVKKKVIEQFEDKFCKFYELELKKMEIKQNMLMVKEKKLLFKDTRHMDPYQQAEYEAMCVEIRKKYNISCSYLNN